MILDELEIGSVSGLHWVRVRKQFAAAAPSPPGGVSVGKRRVGAAAMLFARKVTPLVRTARFLDPDDKRGVRSGYGMGINEGKHPGGRRIHHFAEFKLHPPRFRIPARGTCPIDRGV